MQEIIFQTLIPGVGHPLQAWVINAPLFDSPESFFITMQQCLMNLKKVSQCTITSPNIELIKINIGKYLQIFKYARKNI